MTLGPTSSETAAEIAAKNAKHLAGLAKPPLHFIPPMALYWVGYVFAVGAAKYGWLNWAVNGVTMSVYLDAIDRHHQLIAAGEDIDPETGAPHWAAICCCAMIALDCHCRGKLYDDRPAGHAAPLAEVFSQISALMAERLPKIAAAAAAKKAEI